MFETKIVPYSDLPSEIIRKGLSNNGSGAEYASYLLVFNNGELVRCESDAMEKEDARFSRDLSWIQGALLDAYRFGVDEGERKKC